MRNAVAIAVSLVAIVAVGGWFLRDDGAEIALSDSATDPHLNSVLPVEERLLRLEQILAEERNARMVLEDQLAALLQEMGRIDFDALGAEAARDRQSQEVQREARREAVRMGSQRASFAAMLRDLRDRRRQSLIDNGFPAEEAERVLQLESAAQYDAMLAAHEAARAGEDVDPSYLGGDPQSLLREELGDDEYERYLAAQDMPTSIQVTQVLDSSPASRVGLQPGDEIVSYNGQRVFAINDLRALTLQGTMGEDVVIEIDREGVRMQLSVPRGPVGITGTGVNLRRFNRWGGT